MPTHREVLIIGAGPGGLQLAFFLRRFAVDYIVLEREYSVAGFFRKFPRHRRLISINKPMTGFYDSETNLRWDWHTLLGEDFGQGFPCRCKDYFPLADDYVEYLKGFALRNEIEIAMGADVVSITRRNGRFLVICRDSSEYTANALVIATGLSAPRRPEFPGAEDAEPYSDVSVDATEFRLQRVAILGKGNAAFETANNLVEVAASIYLISPSPIRLACRSRYPGHIRATNASFLDTHSLRCQNAIIDASVERIQRRGNELQIHFRYSDAPQRTGQITVDRAISCLGFGLDTAMFGTGVRPLLCHNDRYAALTSSWESVNVPALYFAGNLMHARDFQRGSSGFVHGFRYNISALAKILRNRLTGASWEFDDIEVSPEALAVLISTEN
jgi:thioredoxin reductase